MNKWFIFNKLESFQIEGYGIYAQEVKSVFSI